MGIFQFFTNVFESIFMSSSPEVKKKQALHKIDSELKNIQPNIFKSGMLQPNFAELIRILYENTKPIDDLLSETISSDDVKRHNFFCNQLLLTGFTGTSQEKLENLSYENRKEDVINSNLPVNKALENQRHTLEFLIHELNNPDFVKIDEVITQIQQLTDICRFKYLDVIHHFDPEYSGFNPGYEPIFVCCVPESMASNFQDLYFISYNFKVNSSLIRAVTALVHLQKGSTVAENDAERYAGYLKKINTIFSRYLTPEVLKKLICTAKKEPDFVPQTASYKANSRQKFAEYLQEKFLQDEERIKNEIKDSRISSELKILFEGRPLSELRGYCQEANVQIRQNCSTAYTWITPLQIIKTFVAEYFNPRIRALLNDVIIEGFFNSPSYKSDFSAIVYACLEIPERLEEFEKSFDHGEKNDKAIIEGYISDSHKNADFVKKLVSTVDNVNEEAHRLVQEVCSNFFDLYKQINELLIDSKKTKPGIISNLKVLMNSTRNRDNASQLEQQFDNWRVFLEIMKNYAIIGEIERK